MHKSPPPPRPARFLPNGSRPADTGASHSTAPVDDSGWLVRFIVVVCLLGAAAILLITLLKF
jgi:hypothetical protein